MAIQQFKTIEGSKGEQLLAIFNLTKILFILKELMKIGQVQELVIEGRLEGNFQDKIQEMLNQLQR